MDKGIVKTILSVDMSNYELEKKIIEFMKLLRDKELELDKDVEVKIIPASKEDLREDSLEELLLTFECFEGEDID